MNWKRMARWSWLVLPFLLLALWPSVASAQVLGVRSDANGVLYEVTENLKLKPLQVGRRVASAALMGTVNAGSPICPVALVGPGGKCAITAMASDNVSLVPGPNLGKGPVVGNFVVVVQDPNTVDGPELVILRGSFEGRIDLSPAIIFAGSSGAAGAPIGTMKARWSGRGVEGGPLQGLRARGKLEGTFRVPIDIGYGTAFYGDDQGNFFPADTTEEFSLGDATVRLEVVFSAQ